MADDTKAPETVTPEQTKPETTTFTQAELDKAVAKAIATREANIKAEAEKARMAEKGEFEKLLALERAEKQTLLDNQARKDYIIANNLTGFAKFFANVPVVDLPAVHAELTAALATQTQTEIKNKLKSTEPPVTTDPTKPKTVSEMSNEEWAAFRKSKGMR